MLISSFLLIFIGAKNKLTSSSQPRYYVNRYCVVLVPKPERIQEKEGA